MKKKKQGPRFYVVFKVTTEKHVEIEADNWQDAARIAHEMKAPVITEKSHLEGVGLIAAEDYGQYDAFHEVVGLCHNCHRMILEKSCSDACDGLHKDEFKGWCSTEHGHVIWCSHECRDADRKSDTDVPVLDRMASLDS